MSEQTVINIFISSPGDCLQERETAKRVIERLNGSPEAKKNRLTFKRIMWEEIPPGAGEPDNTQLRINQIMKRYDLDHYDIYLGFMKNRLGTPTAAAKSGTVEEFESALEELKSKRQPSEVLFYFINQAGQTKPHQGVEGFKKDLEGRGFLYHQLPSEQFETQLTIHLTVMAAQWHAWPNRLKRLKRIVKPVANAVATLLCISFVNYYYFFDYRSSESILLQAEQAEVVTLLQRWDKLSPMMVLNTDSTRTELNEHIAHKITEAMTLSQGLNDWRLWHDHSISQNSARRAHVKKRLSEKLQALIAQNHSSLEGMEGYTLWRSAYESRLFTSDDKDALQWLADIANRNLFLALNLQGNEPPKLDQMGLLASELTQLGAFSNILTSQPLSAAIQWENNVQRATLAKLSQHWHYVAAVAKAQLNDFDDKTKLVLTDFVARAPNDKLLAFLSTNTATALDHNSQSAIVTGLSQRSPNERFQAALHFIQLATLHGYEEEYFTEPPRMLFEDMVFPSQHTQLMSALKQWIEQQQWPPYYLLEAVLYNLQLNQLDVQSQIGLTKRLVSIQEAAQIGASVNVIEYLQYLKVEPAWEYIQEVLQQHINGQVHYGLAEIPEKAALLLALQRTQLIDNTKVAISLVEKAIADVQADKSMSLSILSQVYANYLSLLAQSRDLDWDMHSTMVDRIIKQRLAGLKQSAIRLSFGLGPSAERDTFWESIIDVPLGNLLDTLSLEQQMTLLQAPSDGLPVASEQFETRLLYLLPLFGQKAWSEAFIDRLIPHILAFELYNQSVIVALAKNLPNVYQVHVVEQIFSHDPAYAILFAYISNSDEVIDIIIGKIQNSTQLIAAENHLYWLPLDKQSDVAAKLITQQLGNGNQGESLLSGALSKQVYHPQLVALAGSILSEPDALVRNPEAFAYFVNHASAVQLQQLDEKSTATVVRDFMSDIEKTQWLAIVQSLSPQNSKALPSLVTDILLDRVIVWADNNSDIGTFSFLCNQSVFHPLLERLLETHPRQLQKILPKLLFDNQLTVEVSGQLAYPNAAFESYLIWLYGRVLSITKDHTVMNDRLLRKLLTQLQQNTLATVRAAALLSAQVSEI
ncbi:DUF4062 domain-containing protein [Pseudoalteromonas luteoviolacea]|uniref:DUF4062 domain-containing protein n=1 Tax=Pseudoalteromonas luteoviolacea H33 TaxID=1365251 RepID=A0A167F4G5_9GAMM|nr:DUF4062 domain-containing protein [Pseudoalteromonas luteoviolacea]KZN51626.1 hypothetical protein N476_12425 [Pseudoalteromonas luteoviolacea H33]KZN79117.1 hypothetical protein N477_06345 [Pseudoalteromonas luteoviolacea H33-S]MBQ4878207.1 hypothetical protein [Pseudoalteromonas luteoviolacea]MBQ4907362.1 hypothetical protein [Pseudoalteromonas luteoviolacea]